MKSNQWERIYKRLFLVRFILLLVVLVLSLIVAYIFWHQGPADKDSLIANQLSTNSTGGCPLGKTCGTTQPKKTYTDSKHGFSIQYPIDAVLTQNSTSIYYNDLLSKPNQNMLSIFLAKDTSTKTNLQEAGVVIAADSSQATVKACLKAPVNLADQSQSPTVSTTTINGVDYMTYSFSDAGAGNLYNSTIYRTVHNNTCYEVVAVIHSSNIGNYDPSDHVTEFDKTAVTAQLDKIVKSITFSK